MTTLIPAPDIFQTNNFQSCNGYSTKIQVFDKEIHRSILEEIRKFLATFLTKLVRLKGKTFRAR